MPLRAIDTIEQQNDQQFPVVKDLALKGGMRVVADAATRDAIDSRMRVEGMFVYTVDTDQLWVLQADLLSWLEFAPSNATGFVVNNIAALSALTSPNLITGSEAYVNSVRDTWYLDTLSAEPANGITVAASAMGGRWLRRGNPSSEWQSQASWFIDGQAGDDENDGLLIGQPIKTWAELVRRIGLVFKVTQDTTIIVVDDLQPDDPIFLSPQTENVLTIAGVRKVQYTGVVDTYTRDPATDNYGTMTANPPWDPALLLEAFLEVTMPQLGHSAIIFDKGAGVAAVATATGSYLVLEVPAPGDPVIAYRCPVVSSLEVHNFNVKKSYTYLEAPTLIIEDIEATNKLFATNAFITSCKALDGQVRDGEVSNLQVYRMYSTGIGGVYGGTFTFLSVVDDAFIISCPIINPDQSDIGWLSIGAGSNAEALFGDDALDGQICVNGLIQLGFNATLVVDGTIFGKTTVGFPYSVSLKEKAVLRFASALPRLNVSGVTRFSLNGINALQSQIPIYDNHNACGVMSNSSTYKVKGGNAESIRVGLVGNASVGTFYLQPNWTEAAAPTVPVKVCNQNGILRNLRVDTSANITGTYAVAVMVNGVSRLSATILNGTATISNISTAYVLTVGDKITVQATLSGGGVAANPVISFEVA